MKKIMVSALVLALAAASAAGAKDREIEYPEGALGYGAIMSEDYATAERQLRDYQAHKDDPARLINFGQVLAKTGRVEQAAKQFKRAIEADNVELILADGRTIESRKAALRALESLNLTDGNAR